MTAELIDGKAVSLKIKERVQQRVEKLKTNGITPGLSVILVGDDSASQTYVKNKKKHANHSACVRIFIYTLRH